MARQVYGAHTEWTGAPLDRLEQLVALAAQRQWVGLTDDDYVEMGISLSLPCWQYKAIEAKLKEKNT
jgi:hypothetical protein